MKQIAGRGTNHRRLYQSPRWVQTVGGCACRGSGSGTDRRHKDRPRERYRRRSAEPSAADAKRGTPFPARQSFTLGGGDPHSNRIQTCTKAECLLFPGSAQKCADGSRQMNAFVHFLCPANRLSFAAVALSLRGGSLPLSRKPVFWQGGPVYSRAVARSDL